jgi:hypothetical protein
LLATSRHFRIAVSQKLHPALEVDEENRDLMARRLQGSRGVAFRDPSQPGRSPDDLSAEAEIALKRLLKAAVVVEE